MRGWTMIGALVILAGCFRQSQNLSRERGEVQTQAPGQSVDRGRIGSQPSLPQGPSNWSGLLLDAACRDRSLENLLSPPADEIAVENEPTNQNVRPNNKAAGIWVAPRVLRLEQGREIRPDTPDHASRYASASCAITADTASFALLLRDGRLLNLDEGGNTLALETFQATPAGRAILNGKTGGLKPYATVRGLVQGDRLKTDGVQLAVSGV